MDFQWKAFSNTFCFALDFVLGAPSPVNGELPPLLSAEWGGGRYTPREGVWGLLSGPEDICWAIGAVTFLGWSVFWLAGLSFAVKVLETLCWGLCWETQPPCPPRGKRSGPSLASVPPGNVGMGRAHISWEDPGGHLRAYAWQSSHSLGEAVPGFRF